MQWHSFTFPQESSTPVNKLSIGSVLVFPEKNKDEKFGYVVKFPEEKLINGYNILVAE